MATDIDRYSMPDVQGIEPIDTMLARLRKDISSECSGLLRKTRMTSLVSVESGSRRAKLWEGRINGIIEANASTYSIEELRRLRRECSAIRKEMSRFEA